MKKKSWVAAALAALLVACAPFEWPTETMGSPGGYTKTIKVVPPADVCDIDAYIDGYRSGYMLAWNQEINKKLEIYRQAVEQNPMDNGEKANYELYKDKLFDLKSVNEKETRYGFVPSSVECEFHSHALGKGQGSKDAARDVSALRVQPGK